MACMKKILYHKEEKKADPHKQNSPRPRPRMTWDHDMHTKFLRAVHLVGIGAGPKKLLEVMNVEGMTRGHISSHIQKFRLRMARIKEGKYVAAPGSSSPTMQNPTPLPSSLYYWKRYRGVAKETISLASFAPTTIGNDGSQNISTSCCSGLTYPNQPSEGNNQMTTIGHSAYTQLNLVESPAVNGRGNINNNSNLQTNSEALGKNPIFPPIGLTNDNIDYEQQQNSTGASVTTRQLNFDVVANSAEGASNLTGATHTLSNSDVGWPDMNERRNMNNVSNREPNIEALINYPDIPHVVLTIDDDYLQPQQIAGTVLPSQLNLINSVENSIWRSNLSGAAMHTPNSGESGERVVFSNENYGTGDMSGIGGIQFNQEDDNVGVGIGFDLSEWDYIADLDLPYCHDQEGNNAQSSSVQQEEMEDNVWENIAKSFCD